MPEPSFSLLSQLWLCERSAGLLRAAVEAGLPDAAVEDLMPAYSDLFLLNIYPYGSVFTDPAGEMNGPGAAELAAHYERAGFAPPEILQVGAADHVGLCLAFLERLLERRAMATRFAAKLLEWTPVLAIAIDRDSSTHPFYRQLAQTTLDRLFELVGEGEPRLSRLPSVAVEEEEIGLEEIVCFLLAPARCGFFFSRSRLGELAREIGLALAFGSRRDVCRALFLSAGERGVAPRLIERLGQEVSEWEASLRELAARRPAWRGCGQVWGGRLAATRGRLAGMRSLLDRGIELEYENVSRKSVTLSD
jgi:TorA maturation chaperone TorD